MTTRVPIRSRTTLSPPRRTDTMAMLTLIEHGEVYAPQPLGTKSLLLGPGPILKIGAVDAAALARLDVPCDTIDARDCYVVPGLIDPHAHLIGAGGESGFQSRVPEMT